MSEPQPQPTAPASPAPAPKFGGPGLDPKGQRIQPNRTVNQVRVSTGKFLTTGRAGDAEPNCHDAETGQQLNRIAAVSVHYDERQRVGVASVTELDADGNRHTYQGFVAEADFVIVLDQFTMRPRRPADRDRDRDDLAGPLDRIDTDLESADEPSDDPALL